MPIEGITFATLLTAAGAGIAGAIITAIVALLRGVMPTIVERVTGALLAFILSAILYVLAAIATDARTLDRGLEVFLAWLACATAAVGTHQVVLKNGLTRKQTSPDA